MNTIESPVSAALPVSSRRTSPRIEVLGQLYGQLVAMDVPFVVHNLGAGGFGMESAIEFPVGATHQFGLTTHTGLRVIVTAVTRHCQALGAGDRYLSGFEFLHEPDGRSTQAIASLLEASTSALLFQ